MSLPFQVLVHDGGPLMYAYITRLLAIALLGILAPVHALAQSPSLDSLLILPPSPNPSTEVLANLGGIVNMTGMPNIRTESRRIDNDIRVDVLIDESGVLAPAVMVPWMENESLG